MDLPNLTSTSAPGNTMSLCVQSILYRESSQQQYTKVPSNSGVQKLSCVWNTVLILQAALPAGAPALIPIKMGDNGPTGLPLSVNIHMEKLQFLGITERVLLETSVTPKKLKDKYGSKVPYDVNVPSIPSQVDRRVCKAPGCKRYHSTIQSMKSRKVWRLLQPWS